MTPRNRQAGWWIWGGWLLLAQLLRVPELAAARSDAPRGTSSLRDREVDNYFRGSVVRTDLVPPTGEETTDTNALAGNKLPPIDSEVPPSGDGGTGGNVGGSGETGGIGGEVGGPGETGGTTGNVGGPGETGGPGGEVSGPGETGGPGGTNGSVGGPGETSGPGEVGGPGETGGPGGEVGGETGGQVGGDVSGPGETGSPGETGGDMGGETCDPDKMDGHHGHDDHPDRDDHHEHDGPHGHGEKMGE